MTTTIHTTRYVFSHGKSPRGRGGWIFSTLDCDNFQDPSQAFMAQGFCTFAAACAQAREWAKMAGHEEIEVLP